MKYYFPLASKALTHERGPTAACNISIYLLKPFDVYLAIDSRTGGEGGNGLSRIPFLAGIYFYALNGFSIFWNFRRSFFRARKGRIKMHFLPCLPLSKEKHIVGPIIVPRPQTL